MTNMDTFKNLVDITIRIDERVNTIIGKQEDISKLLDKIIDRQQNITNRLTIIEAFNIKEVQEMLKDRVSKIEQEVVLLKSKQNSSEQIWRRLLSGGIQIVAGIIVGVVIAYLIPRH